MFVAGGTDLWQATSPTLTKTANSSGLFFMFRRGLTDRA